MLKTKVLTVACFAKATVKIATNQLCNLSCCGGVFPYYAWLTSHDWRPKAQPGAAKQLLNFFWKINFKGPNSLSRRHESQTFLEAQDPKVLRLPGNRGEFCCCCFSLVLCLNWSITWTKMVRMTPKFVWVILCINPVIPLSHQSFESSWLLTWVIMI